MVKRLLSRLQNWAVHQPRSARPVQRPGANPHMLDVRVLTRVLRAVEESVDEQEIVLSPKQKAELIAHLYDVAVVDWTLLDQMVVDRMVWMGETKKFGRGIYARES